MVDAKDNIKVNSDETRKALEYLKKLMAVNPPEVYAWDDAGNNRWIISGKGAGIMNPPSSWAVAKRDNPKVGGTDLAPSRCRPGPKGRFVGQLPQFYGCGAFSKNKSAAKDLLLHMSQRNRSRNWSRPSFGLRPAVVQEHVRPADLEDGRPADRHRVQLSAARRRARPRWPARRRCSEVGAQIYNQAINTVMVSKFTQGNEKLDDVIKWAEKRARRHLAGLSDSGALKSGTSEHRHAGAKAGMHGLLNRQRRPTIMADTVQSLDFRRA